MESVRCIKSEKIGKSGKGEGGSLIIGPAGNSFSGPHAAGVAADAFS